MLYIPYIKQPDSKSCALASYAMVAKYFFPKTSFEEIAKASDWQKGYVVWTFKFWFWIMNKGIIVNEYDTLDYETWAKKGIKGLRKSVSEKEFNYYIKNTKDIESYSQDIQQIINHPNFNFFRQKPKFNILEKAVKSNNACEVVLDSRTLRGLDGFSLHRVIVLDITNDIVIFHDPAYGPNEKTSIKKFKKAWLEKVSEPELCIYEKT